MFVILFSTLVYRMKYVNTIIIIKEPGALAFAFAYFWATTVTFTFYTGSLFSFWLHDLRNLSSSTRDWTPALAVKVLGPNHCCCCCQVASVVSDSVRPQRRQPARLPRPWDSPNHWTTSILCILNSVYRFFVIQGCGKQSPNLTLIALLTHFAIVWSY